MALVRKGASMEWWELVLKLSGGLIPPVLVVLVILLYRQMAALKGAIEAQKETISALQVGNKEYRERMEMYKKEVVDHDKSVERLKRFNEENMEDFKRQMEKDKTRTKEELLVRVKEVNKYYNMLWKELEVTMRLFGRISVVARKSIMHVMREIDSGDTSHTLKQLYEAFEEMMNRNESVIKRLRKISDAKPATPPDPPTETGSHSPEASD
jgi:hypothetical protein